MLIGIKSRPRREARRETPRAEGEKGRRGEGEKGRRGG
jgi:hypothetical protein